MIILTAILSFLAGSIPFGLLIARYMGLGDVRKIGSGNIGATNVLRTGSKKAAAATLLLDGLKVFFPVLIAAAFGPLLGSFALISALLGHCFSPWLGFKGGKGVAGFIGALFAISIWLALLSCIIWLVTAKFSKISSIGAIAMVAAAPFIALVLNPAYAIGLAAASILIVYQHRENIRRIKAGVEPKIGKK